MKSARKAPGKAKRAAKAPRKAKSTPKLDPVTLEVIRNALPAVANEMAADLQRTSYAALDWLRKRAGGTLNSRLNARLKAASDS